MKKERLQDSSPRVQVSRRLAPTPTDNPQKPRRLHCEELEKRLAPDGPYGPFNGGWGPDNTAGWGC
jgi:hypothetical protein